MQTIIGIVICVIVIIIFTIGYMNNYEGATDKTSTETTPTTATTGKTITSPSGDIPLKTAVENAEKAATAKEATINLTQNKSDYAEQINHLLDYYDNRTIDDIANARQDENGDYDLSSIIRYKNIKEALIQSLEYINGY